MKQLLLSILVMTAITQLNAQNVGIGTETPEEKLEVNGNLRFTFGSHKVISVSTGPSQSLQANNLTISAGSLSPQTLSGVGGSLELQAGNFRNPGTGGGNIFFTAGRNSLADGSAPNAKHGFIVFRGGASYQGQTIVEHARMDGTSGNWGFGTSTTTSKVNIEGLGGLHVNSLNFGIGAGAIDWIAGNFGGIAGNRVVMGLLNTVASIGAHNEALNDWDNLAINPGGGNVGIGTSAPANKLSVAGTMDVTGSIGIGLPAPHASLHLAPLVDNRRIILWEDANNAHQFYGFGINASTLRYQVPTTAASHIFYAGTSTTTSQELARIQGNGNIGIGTASPGYKVDVVGTGGPRMRVFSQDAFYAGYISKNNTREFFAGVQATVETPNATSGYHIFDNTAGVQRMVIDENGRMGISTSTPANRLSVNGNADVAGNLGVGTPAPAAKLDVNGTSKFGAGGSIINSIIKVDIGIGIVGVNASNSAAVSLAVAGAAVGASVFVSPSDPLPAGFALAFARVKSANTVEVVFANGTNAAGNVPAMTLYITVVN